MNSLYGRFGLSPTFEEFKVVDSIEEYDKLTNEIIDD